MNQPQELVPVHPVHKVQDWDAAPGAIEWPRLVSFLKQVKTQGSIPPDHKSHDHLNLQTQVPLTDASEKRWRSAFTRELDEHPVIVGLVDGFLLYWNEVWAEDASWRG